MSEYGLFRSSYKDSRKLFCFWERGLTFRFSKDYRERVKKLMKEKTSALQQRISYQAQDKCSGTFLLNRWIKELCLLLRKGCERLQHFAFRLFQQKSFKRGVLTNFFVSYRFAFGYVNCFYKFAYDCFHKQTTASYTLYFINGNAKIFLQNTEDAFAGKGN